MNHINRLPKELLILIMAHMAKSSNSYQCDSSQREMLIHLCRCTLVSKGFYEAAISIIWSDPTQYRRTLFSKTPTPPLLLASLQSTSRSTYIGQHIRRLQLDGGDSIEVMVPLISYTPLLKILVISCYHRVPRDVDAPLRQIPSLCPHLKSLTLSGLEFGDQALTVLSQHCRLIQTLTFRLCTGFSDRAVNTLLAGYQVSLQSFSLSVNRALPDHLGNHLHFGPLKQLTSLSLIGCAGIDNEFLYCSQFPHLTECQLRGSGVDIHADPGALFTFLGAHPLLQSVYLWNCKVDDRTLLCLSPSIIPNLYHLNLTDNDYPLSAFAVRQLVNNCMGLCWLHLNNCSVPSHCFPEVSHWSVKMELLKPEDILNIRRNDSKRILTVENNGVSNGDDDRRIQA